MEYLVDTQSFLWFREDNPLLPALGTIASFLTDEEIRTMDEAACGLSPLLADTA